jgi:TolB-like protein/cytochrome c-type biogenesis protein CcmH/NrfG
MGEESPNSAETTPTGAVFLSYASQDAEPARKICDALRAAGIEVWFDQSELRGGDAWDRQIRERIHHCRLFIALISAQTEARDEGYFRREWRLAVDRTNDMLENKAFLLPVAIDATPERGAAVPDKFHEVQWTRLRGGEAPPEFVARIRRLLAPEPLTIARSSADVAAGSSPISRTTSRASRLRRALPVSAAVPVLVALAYLLIHKPWISNTAAPQAAAPNAISSSPAPPAAFTPPPHSIAVLPFVNMSGDRDQEYFSDGLSEELLNSLARINELQVAARTSSFSFKGKYIDIGTIARRLNVSAILEGSVRRSGHKVRITAQLNSAVTGFHLWSQTYDRDLGDVLKLQTEIATAVAEALKVALLGDVAAKIQLGGTRNAAAFDAYLRGLKAYSQWQAQDLQTAIASYTEAIRLDPNYALAYSGRSLAHSDMVSFQVASLAVFGEELKRARTDAQRALVLAPELAEGHLALAYSAQVSLDLVKMQDEFQQARERAPSNAEVLRLGGVASVYMGHFDAGLAALRQALVLDPLNPRSYFWLAEGFGMARRYADAIAAYDETISLKHDFWEAYGLRGLYFYLLGDLEGARSSCAAKPENWASQWCLALAYEKLGRHGDAEAALNGFVAASGDTAAYQYATIYAHWGKPLQAMQWLNSALRVRDPGLASLKSDPLMDPLRREPRFQAVMRELKFPE